MKAISATCRKNLNNRYINLHQIKTKKSVIALAIAIATLSVAGTATAAYVEQGIIGDKTSW